MAYPPLSLEEAFRQDIEAITDKDDTEFIKRHYLFVNGYRCKQEKLPQRCIEDGRDLFTKFVHGSKLAKQRAFYCMAKCNEDGCYQECKNSLRQAISGFTEKLEPVVTEYLLTFAPQNKNN